MSNKLLYFNIILFFKSLKPVGPMDFKKYRLYGNTFNFVYDTEFHPGTYYYTKKMQLYTFKFNICKIRIFSVE